MFVYVLLLRSLSLCTQEKYIVFDVFVNIFDICVAVVV